MQTRHRESALQSPDVIRLSAHASRLFRLFRRTLYLDVPAKRHAAFGISSIFRGFSGQARPVRIMACRLTNKEHVFIIYLAAAAGLASSPAFPLTLSPPDRFAVLTMELCQVGCTWSQGLERLAVSCGPAVLGDPSRWLYSASTACMLSGLFEGVSILAA